ncbi:MAG TPA: PVC-type heme-binding CxxCH protein [Planctomicrobium sp.]|nr:PVC-type heme-binding CxxCH protein [Planctomicrobium sp.]
MTAWNRNGFRINLCSLCLLAWGISVPGVASLLHAQDAGRSETLGLKVPEGFTITRFAGDDLAHDIHSMTLDSLGRVVVSGPGSVKILIDDDQDGVADRAETLVSDLATGAQGMFFVGRDLICAGGEGLIRYRDRNGDDKADGPPDVFLRVKTGSEHDLHAIRKGPDGWWYIIAGNTAGVNPRYAGLPTSPVTKPHAGVLLRLKPDLSGGEIFAHGFRNAYDFDFNPSGELFAFDSDGENVMSLPAYQPTKLFHVLPGSHQGWVTNNWIRPDYFFDAAPVVTSFGRGSPTGVVSYRHTAFPDRYHGALFVQDWTFGRVYVVPMKQNGSTWKGKPEEFITPIGQHGFAPTDIEIGPEGELYVCVGGRGTHGSVYCVRPVTKNPKSKPWPGGSGSPTTSTEKLNLCLRAPQPLSSWSRRVWEPVAKELSSEQFVNAAVDSRRTVSERVRAIEILTEKYNGIGGDIAAQLARDAEPLIRSRAAWSLGRTQAATPNARTLEPFFKDADASVVRAAMEAVQGGSLEQLEEFVIPVAGQLSNSDQLVRQSAMRVLMRADQKTVHSMAMIAFKENWNAAIPVAASYAKRSEGFSSYAVDIGVRLLKGKNDDRLKLEGVRVLQLGLGDVVPKESELTDVFQGYESQEDLSARTDEMKRLANDLLSVYPTQTELLNKEIERVIAMIQPEDSMFLERVLEQITAQSHPVDDIHRLIVLARLPAERTHVQSTAIADAILNLQLKIDARKLQQDSHWNDRILEMCDDLVKRDRELPMALLNSPLLGHPKHVPFVQLTPVKQLNLAARVFLERALKDPDYEWSPDLVYLLGATGSPILNKLLRSKFEDLSLRGAILTTLASEPDEQDRAYFLAGIDSGSVETMQLSVEAMHFLSASADGAENVALARTIRKMGNTGDERQIRDQTVELLRRNLRVPDTYILGKDGDPQQAAIDQWLEVVRQKFPKEFAESLPTDAGSLADLKNRLSGIAWEKGNALNGARLFQNRSCAQCHGQSQALGPDLTGVAGRFSHFDLFTAIVFPSQDVPVRYQGVQVMTTDGHLRSGMVAYEGLDGMVLRDANSQTYRIEANEIEDKRPMTRSFMPEGLLNGCSDQDYADLYAYLRSLGVRSTAAHSE